MAVADRWTWKPKSVEPPLEARLLYEPGNLGDLLKGEWALSLAEAFGAEFSARGFADPFAGAPVYPAAAPSIARIGAFPDTLYAAAQAPFLERGQLASTARLLLARPACAQSRALLFDADSERRAAWAHAALPIRLMDAVQGEDALGALCAGEERVALVLIDPYDFFHRWGALAPSISKLAERDLVLIYHLNKAPRGPGHMDQYDRLLRGLARGLRPDSRLLLGRIPMDARLPRGWHEVLLAGPTSAVDQVEQVLAQKTQSLAARLAADGAFETFGRA